MDVVIDIIQLMIYAFRDEVFSAAGGIHVDGQRR
jgi:hypothetical protein